MPLISDRDRQEIKKMFAALDKPVKIIHFTQTPGCEFCGETRQLLEEIASLSDQVTLEVYNFALDRDQVEKYRIDRVPATILVGDKDYGIGFYGIPAGFEFATLLKDILMVSQRDSGLSAESRKKLAGLKTPVHLQVFVTPACPYCPGVVHMAHQMAMDSDMVTADMVEATEFPELSLRYGVRGVPQTIANEKHAVTGALPEKLFLDHVLKAVESTEAA